MDEEAIDCDALFSEEQSTAFFEEAKRRWEEEVDMNTIVRHYLDIEHVIQQHKPNTDSPLGSVQEEIVDDFTLAMEAWNDVDENHILDILKEIYQYPPNAFENNHYVETAMEQITDDPVPGRTPLVALMIASERYLNYIRKKYSKNFYAFSLVPMSEINYFDIQNDMSMNYLSRRCSYYISQDNVRHNHDESFLLEKIISYLDPTEQPMKFDALFFKTPDDWFSALVYFAFSVPHIPRLLEEEQISIENAIEEYNNALDEEEEEDEEPWMGDY